MSAPNTVGLELRPEETARIAREALVALRSGDFAKAEDLLGGLVMITAPGTLPASDPTGPALLAVTSEELSYIAEGLRDQRQALDSQTLAERYEDTYTSPARKALRVVSRLLERISQL